MSKAAKMAKVSVKGGFHLLWGLVASTVISSVGTIFIGNLLGDENYGLYTIALAAPNLISIFRDWGISVAMVKYTAQYNSEDEAAKIRGIFTAGILFETILGLILSAVAFTLSGLLAQLYRLPNITPLIQIASFTILTSALLSTAQAAFTGMERMELNSIALVIQSIIKTAVILTLVILGLGPLGAVIGFSVAILIAGLIAVLLMWTLYKNLPKPTNNTLGTKNTIKIMFNYGLPLSIASIIATFQTTFYTFILPIFVAPGLYGNYGIANAFVVLITFFAAPVSTMLFPAFSKLDPQKDKETLKNVFQFSIKYASLLVVPAAAIVITLSSPGISILFPAYSAAPLFLALLAINYLYTALGSLSIGSLINGQGQTKFNLKLSLITFAIGFPLSILLISQFGVLGLIITTLTAGIPSLIIALRWLKKQYDVTVDWASSAKILLSGATASAITYALITQLAFSNLTAWFYDMVLSYFCLDSLITQLAFSKLTALIVGAIVFLLTFIIAIVLTRAITKSDIDNMRNTMTVLGPLAHVANLVLNIIEKLMTILRL